MNTIPYFCIDQTTKPLSFINVNKYVEAVNLDSTLIEGHLLRFPIPPLYLDIENNLLLEHKIISNFYLFRQDKDILQGLKYFKDLEGLTYSQLPRNYQRRIEETEVTIIKLEHYKDKYILEQVKNFWSPNYD